MKQCLWILFLIYSFSSFSQESIEHKLALQYFNSQEFDKAEPLLKDLYKSNAKTYFKYYKKTLIGLKKQKEALELSKQQLKLFPNDLDLRVEYALDLKDAGDQKSFDKELQNLIKENSTTTNKAVDLYLLLEKNKEYSSIIKLLLDARKELKNPNFMTDRLIGTYYYLKDYDAASELFINEIDAQETQYFNIVNQIQMFTENKEFLKRIERQIFSKLSKNSNSDKWNEVAIWLSLQLKDYDEAIVLAKAIDKRNQENGNRVFNIANIAQQEISMEAALNGYNYLITNEKNLFVASAREEKINCLITSLEKSKDTQIKNEIQKEFEAYFKSYSLQAGSGSVQLLYADFLMKYEHNLDSSIAVLLHLSKVPLISKDLKSVSKLALADCLLMKGEIWEAALIYGQVDKDEKDSPLGEEARFKNSRLFYYNGEFELAEELLSILKSSTTELLANDALYLALFIQENRDNDTLESAMKSIAHSELLFYQNKDLEGMKILTEVKHTYPSSKLIDDILMIEALYSYRKEQYLQAEQTFSTLIEKYKNFVLADKALFYLAKTQEEHLNNPEKAKENYLKILTQFKDSVYGIDARKRYRKLRGEMVDEENL